MDLTDYDFQQANERAERKRRRTVGIRQVKCSTSALSITFSTGVELKVPTRLIQELSDAPASALREIEISPTQMGLHFPAIDADVFVPGLLKGIYGSRAWMQSIASEMGSRGGRVSSPQKRLAAARNGALGGRPKKAGVV